MSDPHDPPPRSRRGFASSPPPGGGGGSAQSAAAGSGEVQTTVQARSEVPDTTLVSLRAVVIEGPDAGLTFTLDPQSPLRVLVGTSPACDIRLSDPTVS